MHEETGRKAESAEGELEAKGEGGVGVERKADRATCSACGLRAVFAGACTSCGATVPTVSETAIADAVQRVLAAIRKRVEEGKLTREEALKSAHVETRRVLEELGLPSHVVSGLQVAHDGRSGQIAVNATQALARLQGALAPLGVSARVRDNVLPFTSKPTRRATLERLADVYGEKELTPQQRDELASLRLEEERGKSALEEAEAVARRELADAEAKREAAWMQLEIFDSLDVERPVHAVIVRARGVAAGALHFNDREDRDRVLRALRSLIAADAGTLIEVTAIVHDLEGAKVDELTHDLYRRLTTRVVGVTDSLDGIRRRCESEAMQTAMLVERDYKIDTSIAECVPAGSGKLIAEVKLTLAKLEAARHG